MLKSPFFPVVPLAVLLVLISTASSSALPPERPVPPRPYAVSFSKPVADEPAPGFFAPRFDEDRDSAATATALSSSPRVSLGLRFLNHWLLSPKKGQPFHNSFVGSINRLDIHNSLLPNPYLRFSAPVGPVAAGLEFSYTRYHISTRDNGGGDGAIDTDAFFLVALAELPNPSPLTPYVQLGAACAHNDFDPIGSWSSNNRRKFDLDDSVGFVGALGCAWAVADCLDLDLFLRYMDYDVDGKYVFRGDSRPAESFTFTTENISAGLGVAYVF